MFYDLAVANAGSFSQSLIEVSIFSRSCTYRRKNCIDLAVYMPWPAQECVKRICSLVLFPLHYSTLSSYSDREKKTQQLFMINCILNIYENCWPYM